jgi:hypothetical protein
MIVATAFLAAGAMAWAHFEMLGRVVFPGLTVWVAWYGAVLLALALAAWRSDSPAMKVGAAIMAVSFLSAHVIWNGSAWPIAAQCLKNIVVACALIGAAIALHSRALAAAAALHLVIVAIGAAVDLGLILQGRRPLQFLAWSFPDISAGLQHAALVSIGFGDAARSEDDSVVRDPRSGADRSAHGLARAPGDYSGG